MKKRIPTFLAGALTTALIGGLGISALAASGAMTITVDPINIQVNGQTFQPKDAQGADVPVFAYNGTTYAPLRALAEAYGLEVGYDAEANMATVGEVAPNPDTTAAYADWTAVEEAAYQEFKGLWEITKGADEIREKDGKHVVAYVASYQHSTDNTTAEQEVSIYSPECSRRLAYELRAEEDVTMIYFVNDPADGSQGAHILPLWTIDE